MYTLQSTREIFELLAHSSIMKLNSTSMQKLFDLMLMGFKYQCQACCKPIEIHHLTLKHIYTMCDLVKDSPAEWLLRECAVRLKDLSETFSAYDHFVIRQQVFKFFEDKHIKVSLFI